MFRIVSSLLFISLFSSPSIWFSNSFLTFHYSIYHCRIVCTIGLTAPKTSWGRTCMHQISICLSFQSHLCLSFIHSFLFDEKSRKKKNQTQIDSILFMQKLIKLICIHFSFASFRPHIYLLLCKTNWVNKNKNAAAPKTITTTSTESWNEAEKKRRTRDGTRSMDRLWK